LLLCSSPTFSQQSPRPGAERLDLGQYISRLDQYRETLSNSSGASTAVQSLRSTLPSRWIVAFREQEFSVDTDWLDRSLQKIENGKPSDRDELTHTEQRLQRMQQAASELAAQSSRDSASARSQLDEILRALEFRGSEASEIDLAGAQTPGLDWHQWLGRAREAAVRGDYRQAIFAAYWTGVTRLEETKLVPQDESQTPREILRLLKRDRTEYAPLARLTRTFELVWYGHRDATASEWQDALQQLDKIGCPLPLTLRTANS